MPQPPQPITDAARKAVEGLLDLPLGSKDDDVESYEISDAVANAPLANADVDAIVATAMARISAEHLVFPEAKALVEEAVIALLGGHLLLHGPPGTGKTRLAGLLAEVFECTVHIETGTPDWSTYDVIGGLRPARDQDGHEVLEPWLGHVPRAALECAVVVEGHLDEGEGAQAHWLCIDELSRADIDKAVGPLYTALSGQHASHRKINLWFEDAPERSQVTLPERFRLIGTLNDVDTAFVSQLSQGLQRRFGWVRVGVPNETQTHDELAELARQAAKWHGRLYGDVSDSYLDAYAAAFLEEGRVQGAIKLLADLVRFLRWQPAPDGPRWPVGSAQLLDVLRQTATRAFADTGLDDLTSALDRAAANRLISQTSALAGEQLDAIEAHLTSKPFPRSLTALRHVREPHLTHPE